MAGYLTFQLHGMLSAFGLVAVGEVRPSAPHPTRSAVIGIVAGALGIRRGEEARLRALTDGYGVAVRVDAPGTPLLDYHTVQTPPERKKRVYRTRSDELGGLLGPDEEPYTILSRRGYLCGAAFTACLWARTDPPYSLDALAEALRRPVFAPYLGRKCCPPSLPFHPVIGEFPDVEAALAAYAVDPGVFVRPSERGATCLLMADAEAQPSQPTQYPLLRDLPFHHGRRQFAERRAVLAEVPAAPLRTKEERHVS